MNKKWILILGIVLTALLTLFALKSLTPQMGAPQLSDENKNIKLEDVGYWTCPMHPQVHEDHPGECPICHMKLVRVDPPKSSTHKDDGSSRSEVGLDQQQLQLANIQRIEVEKMDLETSIPVSGRILSSSAVALQIYEDDLRVIKPGLIFTGENGIYSESEITGKIKSVDSIADPSSRTVRVVGSIQNGPKNLLPETSFRGEVKISLKERVAIPESAVLHTGGADLVYIFSDSSKNSAVLEAKKVTLGIKANTYYEVLSGLNPGDIISSGPNFLIDSEAKIRGVNAHTDH